MAMSLAEANEANIVKAASKAGVHSLKKIAVGLGWDVSHKEGEVFDLDLSAVMLGANGEPRSQKDIIFYDNLVGEGIRHTGDNSTGEGDGDDEVIIITFDELPKDIQKIAFTVTIDKAKERGQNFGQVDNAFVRIFDPESFTELFRYDLGKDFSTETGVIVGDVYNTNGEWKFVPIGKGFN